jgi:hypothetical protein
MVIRRGVYSLALWFVSGCATVDSAPHMTASDMATADVDVGGVGVGGADFAVTPPPPKSIDMAIVQPAPTPDLLSTPDLLPAPDLGPFPPGTFYDISVKTDNQLLSVRNQSTLNGSITEEQPPHGTPDQRWTLQVADSGYRIINGQSNTCLDVASSSTADSAATGIYTCSAALSQQWTLQVVAGTGYYNIVNVNSKSCLDLNNGGTTAGTQIFQYHCDGGDNQKWFFTAVQ